MPLSIFTSTISPTDSRRSNHLKKTRVDSLYRFLFAILILLSNNFSAQNNIVDSLKNVLKNTAKIEKNDSTRCKILAMMVESEFDDRLWPAYNNQLFELAESKLKNTSLTAIEKRTFQKYLALALNNMGYGCKIHGDIKKQWTTTAKV